MEEPLFSADAPLPVSWVSAANQDAHLNLGDALSAVMVACVAGRGCEQVPFKSPRRRISAVGTIAHGFSGGEVLVWGSGSSRYRNPHDPRADKVLFSMPPDTRYRVWATRGPYSAAVLAEAEFVHRGIYGDPVWLLPRFYNPPVEKRWELGVIVHLADLADRGFEAKVKDNLVRYGIPEDFKDQVRLIHTITPVSIDAVRQRIDEILACKRIVSTSLHGMVFAESYGIPCLYFSPRGKRPGPASLAIADDTDLDFRIVDLYGGMRVAELPVYVQPRRQATDWAALMRAIDQSWEPLPFDGDALIGAFPGGACPLAVDPQAGLLFEHPLIATLPMHRRAPSSPPLAGHRNAAFLRAIGRWWPKLWPKHGA